MKKFLLFISLFFVCYNLNAQNPTYQEKLYYTCKVWGFFKYNHARVASCLVDWDKVLLKTLPLVKNSTTKEEFNDALDSMIISAGKISTGPGTPDTLPIELKRNRNFSWLNDGVFRSDMKAKFDSIKDNFRPLVNNCWVKKGYGTNKGYLEFPYDDPMIDRDLFVNFPDEDERILVLFKYWNIINYFNPYNYILDNPWDSTLYNYILPVVNAQDYGSFFRAFKKFPANLQDAHVEGLTWSSHDFIMGDYYRSRLILIPTKDEFVVSKSDYPEIAKGDVIETVDGLTADDWKDSLRPYISAGNPNVFNRFMALYLTLGDSGSSMNIKYRDGLGNLKTYSAPRNYKYDEWFADHHNNDTLGTVHFKKWGCNTGYVNMGILKIAEVDSMYTYLRNTKAIIFDLRNYPSESVILPIANLIYPNNKKYVKFTLPDIYHPGTHSWSYQSLGQDGNPDYYKGKVIILCNQQTQSHAEFCCMILKAMPDAVIVGSQTAGADGNITRFNLSRDIQVGFTTLGTFYPDGTETQRIGIVPDSVVYPTSEGIRQGRDEVLEKALEIAGCIVSVDEDVIEERDFSVLPNPATDFIEIKGLQPLVPDDGLKVYNTLGECVIHLTPTLSEGEGARVDVSGLAAGVYVLRIGKKSKLFVKY